MTDKKTPSLKTKNDDKQGTFTVVTRVNKKILSSLNDDSEQEAYTTVIRVDKVNGSWVGTIHTGDSRERHVQVSSLSNLINRTRLATV